MRKQEGKEEAVGIGVEILPSPIQGRADWRNYRAFRLSNGVVGLAVEDKESKTTGMACLVNVGASADPRELSGLAHFCEHMWYVRYVLVRRGLPPPSNTPVSLSNVPRHINNLCFIS